MALRLTVDIARVQGYSLSGSDIRLLTRKPVPTRGT
jgi:hypothetical protein